MWFKYLLFCLPLCFVPGEMSGGKGDSDPRFPPTCITRMTQVSCVGQPLKVAEEQPAADKLRKLICSKLRSKQDDISPFLEVPFDQYIDGMSQASTWGGEPELSVAPECLSRPVDVYMNGATGLQVMSSYTSPYCGKSEPVKVLFNGIGHYDLLIDNSPASRL